MKLNSDNIRKEVKRIKHDEKLAQEISEKITEEFLFAEDEMQRSPKYYYRVGIVRHIFMAGYELAKRHMKEGK